MSSPHKKLGLKVSFPFKAPKKKPTEVSRIQPDRYRIVTAPLQALCLPPQRPISTTWQRRNETPNGNDVFPFACWGVKKKKLHRIFLFKNFSPNSKKKRWPKKKSIYFGFHIYIYILFFSERFFFSCGFFVGWKSLTLHPGLRLTIGGQIRFVTHQGQDRVIAWMGFPSVGEMNQKHHWSFFHTITGWWFQPIWKI